MKTINKEISDALHMLFHCSLKDTDYTTQREQFREVYNYIEYLEIENKKLKEEIRIIKEHPFISQFYKIKPNKILSKGENK